MKNAALVTFLIIGFTEYLVAQTVNTGELIITEGTSLSVVEEFNNTSSGTFINNGDVFIYNHWNNDGLVDHDNNGFTHFIGNAPQSISGTIISYFYNILLNNTSLQPAFELSGEISVANEVDFNTGIVDENNFGGAFVFEQFSDHINTSDYSFVDGEVIKVGDNSFSYPIGTDNYYRYAKISAPEGNGDAYYGSYFLENPDTNFPLDSKSETIEIINNKEYWEITRDNGSSDVILTLSWNKETTTPDEIVASPLSDIHIVRWDEEQQKWLDEGGVVDSFNKTVSTPLLLDKYGIFTLARVKNIVLPLEIIIYNGVSPNGDRDNDYFFIENIQTVANNKVDIYNRWGIKVFSTTNYDTNDNVFRGYSDARLTLGDGLLPSGTYFYILEYDYPIQDSIERIKQTGYLYLNTD